MGKGEIDAIPGCDYCATDGALFRLTFHEWEHVDAADWTDLVDGSTSQATFDSAAGTVFGTWYSNKPSQHKTAAYEAFRAIRLNQ